MDVASLLEEKKYVVNDNLCLPLRETVWRTDKNE